MKRLGHDLTFMPAKTNYNIGQARADQLWNERRGEFEKYDLVITSDTAPLSRIFLRDAFKGKLIIWICTRYNYADQATNDCGFPDPEYYEIIRAATKNPRVRIVAYTAFEHMWAKQTGVDVGTRVVRPTGMGGVGDEVVRPLIPASVDKPKTLFIPPYHNDTKLVDLQGMCQSLGLTAYRGRYAGPNELEGFRGIVHIPYAWSNLALYENLARGLLYFLPSLGMLLKFGKCNEFFWSPPYQVGSLLFSEWYNPANRGLFRFFGSWQELPKVVADTDFAAMRKTLREWSVKHVERQVGEWAKLIEELA